MAPPNLGHGMEFTGSGSVAHSSVFAFSLFFIPHFPGFVVRLGRIISHAGNHRLITCFHIEGQLFLIKPSLECFRETFIPSKLLGAYVRRVS